MKRSWWTTVMAAAICASMQTAAHADDGSVIDVLMLYTPEARDDAGGAAAIQNKITTGLADVNTALGNSNVNFQYRIVHMAEVASYPDPTPPPNESKEASPILYALRNADGIWDEVPVLRNTHKADIVHIIVHLDDFDAGCGSGFMRRSTDTEAEAASYAFSLTRFGCIGYVGSRYQIGHALGHNFGLHHWWKSVTENSQHHDGRLDANGNPLPAPPITDYAYGYVDPQDRFCDIMAGDCPNIGPNALYDSGGFPIYNCPRLQLFSNLTTTHNGAPVGNATSANAARVMNELRLSVSNYRDSTPAGPTPTPTAAPTPTPGPTPPSVAVAWVNLVQSSASGNTLTKSGGAEAYDAGASSSQSIASGDGFLEFTTPNLGYRTAGLGVGDSNQHYSDIDFGIFTRTDGSFNVIEKGSVRSAGGTYAAGNVFRIELAGGVARYYHSGVLVYTSTQAIAYPLVADTALYTPGVQVGSARLGFSSSPTPAPTSTPTPAPTAAPTATPTPGGGPAPVTVTWVNLVQASASGGTLTKSGSMDAYDAGASSSQSIASGDGFLEFTTPNMGYRTAGLGVGDSNQHYSDIDFGIFTRTDGSFNVIEKGSVRSAGGSYAAGDTFRIELSGGVGRYSRNGALVYTSTQAIAYPLVADTALYTPGVQVGTARIGFSSSPTPAPTATPTPAPTAAPTPTPTPGAGLTPVAVSWVNLVQASASGGTLTKWGSLEAYDAGASSSQSIASGDGWLEFSTPALGYRTAGFGVGDSNQHYSDVDFAIFTRTGGSYNVMEKGAVLSAGGTYAAGDVFRIEITGGVVRYYRNGGLVHTSTQAVTYPLVADTALYSPGVQVGNARIAR